MQKEKEIWVKYLPKKKTMLKDVFEYKKNVFSLNYIYYTMYNIYHDIIYIRLCTRMTTVSDYILYDCIQHYICHICVPYSFV